MITFKRNFYVIASLVYLSACGNSNASSLSKDNNYSISESNMAINDLEYLIGLKLNRLIKDGENDQQFKEQIKDIENKKNKIQDHFNNKIDSVLKNEGVARQEYEYWPAFDYTGRFEELSQEYQLMVRVREKVEQLEESEAIQDRFKEIDKEILEAKKIFLLDIIKKDKILAQLVISYKKNIEERSNFLKIYGIEQSDSINFFNKKLKANLSDETTELIMSGIF